MAADGCVPVKTIVYVEILHSHANVLLLHLAGRTTEFRFSTYEEAQCWFRSILDSRRKYFLTVGASLTTLAGLAASNTPVIIPEVSPDTAESWQPPDSGSITGLGIRSMVQAAVGSSVKGGVQGIGQMVAALGNMISGPTDPQDLLDSILTERQVSAIYKMENVLLNQATGGTSARLGGIGKHAMNAFFLRLNVSREDLADNRDQRDGSRKLSNDIAKMFGCGLALWFTSADVSPRTCSIDGDDHAAKMDHLQNSLLESVLLREFQKSCNFSSSEDRSAGMAHNTPFRGDHAESLILTSYIKIIAELSGFLSPLLTPLLLTVASSPAQFLQGLPVESDPNVYVATTAQLLFEKLRQIKADNFRQLPASLLVLMRLVRRLTIGKTIRGAESDGSVSEPREKPERGVYHATASALLFLRLICPSIITPMEWGVLHSSWDGGAVRPLSLPSSSSYDALDDIDTSDCNYCGVGSSSILIIVLAHVLNGSFCDCAASEKGGESVDDHFLFDIWSGSNEDLVPLVSAVKAVTTEIPFSKASELLTFYKNNLADREVLNVDSGTASLFQSGTPSEISSHQEEFSREHKQQVRKALIAVAKYVQKVANQTCVGDMEGCGDGLSVPVEGAVVAPVDILLEFYDFIGQA